MASFLTFNMKSKIFEAINAVIAGDYRQFTHTAIKIDSNRSSGIEYISNINIDRKQIISNDDILFAAKGSRNFSVSAIRLAMVSWNRKETKELFRM